MNQPESTTPRQRLQALLAIPERLRTDAQWDEINELEILLAPENRQGAPAPRGQQNVASRAIHRGPNRWSRGKKPGR